MRRYRVIILLVVVSAILLIAGQQSRADDCQSHSENTGSLKVASDPVGADWYLDGVYAGKTPGVIPAVAMGVHQIMIVKSGYKKRSRQMKIRPGLRSSYTAILKAVPQAQQPGDSWTDPITGIEFVWVPKGCCQMGSPITEIGRDDDEGPRHKVCVDGFWMGKTEVSNRQYRKYDPSHSSRDFKGHSLNGADQPVVHVSWIEVERFMVWLNRQHNSDIQFRLPTEAEWEYAARGGTQTAKYWGKSPDDACRYANVHDRTSKRVNNFSWICHACDDGYPVSAPVGSFAPNEFGLYDMLGNVWEWCQDVYVSDAYHRDLVNNPVIMSKGFFRVERGGSWSISPDNIRAAVRYQNAPNKENINVGFRICAYQIQQVR